MFSFLKTVNNGSLTSLNTAVPTLTTATLSTDVTSPTATSLSTDVIVTISVVITFIVSVIIGFIAGFITSTLCSRKKAVYSPTAERQANVGPTAPASPVYVEVSLKEEIELNTNKAYGPVRL